MMSVKPPDCLTAPELESEAAGLLRAYYGPRLDGGRPFDGRYFDTWRPGPPDTFTAEDILSMAFLGVTINRRAFLTILAPSPDNRFNALLAKVPDRVDFWDAGAPAASSAQWQLYDMLRGLSGIGPTKASKLLARKRRHLIPIRDSVVARVLDLRKPFWAPLYGASQEIDLRARLAAIKARARAEGVALPDNLALLRVFDVVVWMSGITGETSFPG